MRFSCAGSNKVGSAVGLIRPHSVSWGGVAVAAGVDRIIKVASITLRGSIVVGRLIRGRVSLGHLTIHNAVNVMDQWINVLCDVVAVRPLQVDRRIILWPLHGLRHLYLVVA